MKNEKGNTTKKEIQASLQDGMKLVLVKFGKLDKELKVPGLSEKGDIEVPRYVYFSKSNYGYDKELGILAKYCRKCGRWFAVSRLTTEGKWESIYNPTDVHFDSLRFRSDCNACYETQKGKSKRSEHTKPSLKQESMKTKKSSNEGLKKASFFISEDDLQFIKLIKVIDRVSMAEVLSAMIERERKERNLRI